MNIFLYPFLPLGLYSYIIFNNYLPHLWVFSLWTFIMKKLYEIKKKHIIEGMLIQKEKDIYELCNCIFGIRNWVVIYLTLPN